MFSISREGKWDDREKKNEFLSSSGIVDRKGEVKRERGNGKEKERREDADFICC